MAKTEFKLSARVASDNIEAVEGVIKNFIGKSGTVTRNDEEIEIKAILVGESAKDLNRQLLSDMRRLEKKTRIRSEWSSSGFTERFFDYVSKGKRKME